MPSGSPISCAREAATYLRAACSHSRSRCVRSGLTTEGTFSLHRYDVFDYLAQDSSD